MKQEAKKYADKLCEHHLETALTRDDARTNASITIKHLHAENTRLARRPGISEEMKAYHAERKKFFCLVTTSIYEWDPYL